MNPTNQLPTLHTERLSLRPLRSEDAPVVQEYAGEERVATMTSQIPHPYPEAAAEEWIATVRTQGEPCFAITRQDDGLLVGVIGLTIDARGLIAELGFWIGLPFWGNGYCSEAACEMLRYGFQDLGLQRIHAGHFVGNEASGRVQEKIGMRVEGTLRWGVHRFGEMKDLVLRAITRPDWESLHNDGGGSGESTNHLDQPCP